MERINLSGGWLAIAQVALSVLVTLLIFWIKENIHASQKQGLRNLEKKQDIYASFYTDIERIHRILGSIDHQMSDLPNSTLRIEKLIDHVDSLRMDVTFDLYGNKSMQVTFSKWTKAREDFLAAVSILIYESGLTKKDKDSFKTIQSENMNKLSEYTQELRHQIRKELKLA